MEDWLPWILGVPAAAIHATGYILYNIQTKKGTSRPNVVSWSIWAMMAGMNAFTFAEVSSFPHALQYMVGTFAAFLTFLLALRWKRFDWPSKTETVVFILCLISMGVWWYLKDARTANLVMMVPFLISFHPTLKGVYIDPRKETPRSWWVWTLACAFTLTNNVISWNGDFVSVLNPAIVLVCHMLIAVLCRKGRNAKL